MISIRNLVKRFGPRGETLALDHVNLDIAPGEIFFLLGPSGCGKTTLLRCIAGFVTPDEGTIRFGEEDITRVPPHRRNTAMMFQSYALWPHLTVAGNVAFGLEERKVPRAEITRRVRDALALVKMDALAGRRVHELSGGQQQRAALARALVVRPRCLLLDEPLSNLDAKLRAEMRGEIRRVCKESGLTAIYVSHDQKEALSIGDRVAVMDAGRVCQVGAPREVYARPGTRFVAEFIGETNFIAGVLEAVEENGGALASTPLGALRGVFAETARGAQRGDAALLSIRPESWRLRAEPAAENSVRGRIAETAFLGEMARLRFAPDSAPASADALAIFEINPRPRENGAELFAVADPADVVILPADAK